MAHARVAADAGDGGRRASGGIDIVNDVLMALRQAFSVTRRLRSLIWIGSWKSPVVKASECKKPCSAFVKYFGTKPGRRMAIVAGGDRAMAGFHPGIEMVLHDVAVGAGFGIVPEIRCRPWRRRRCNSRVPAVAPRASAMTTASSIVNLFCGLSEPSDRAVFMIVSIGLSAI